MGTLCKRSRLGRITIEISAPADSIVRCNITRRLFEHSDMNLDRPAVATRVVTHNSARVLKDSLRWLANSFRGVHLGCSHAALLAAYEAARR